MQILHQSRSLEYRDPFGAVPTGTPVRFALKIRPEGQTIKMVSLCYAYGLKTFQESRLRLTPSKAAAADWRLFQGSLTLPSEPGLFFYWFEIDTSGGRIYYTSDRENQDGGGQVASRPHYLAGEAHTPPAWNVTVFDARFTVPEWLPGAVFYQIFPDRFNRGSQFTPDRFDQVKEPERIFHLDWNEEVDFRGRPETGYVACDFFGGSLNGVREKLDYLESLGVTVLYLNPIFKARSNHRYDTGDYEVIDPLLGNENDFKALCRDAARRGIRIMLDGVFNHTGADSRYFNKYGRYQDLGAWQEILGQGISPFGSWYFFQRKGDQPYYDSWWGFQDLPSVNENDLVYRSFITGTQGIVRRWLKLGAAGWRLDVSDELPDSFIRDIRRAAREEKPDAAILGEVWEDASLKASYGSYRDFLFGQTHDAVMGYPFQQALIGWLAGSFAAEKMCAMLETIRENYPLPSFYCNFNLIGSHDIPRAITALAGMPDPGSRDAQARLRLTKEARASGEALLRLAALFQMTFPGCPVIYYGDETGMEGYRDPFNRRTFPWGNELAGKETSAAAPPSGPGKLAALPQWFADLGALRRSLPVLRTGFYKMLQARGDCVIFERTLKDGRDIFGNRQDGPARVLVLINRNANSRTVQVDGRTVVLPAFGGFIEVDGETRLAAVPLA